MRYRGQSHSPDANKFIDGTTSEFMTNQWHPHCPRWLGKSTQVDVLDD